MSSTGDRWTEVTVRRTDDGTVMIRPTAMELSASGAPSDVFGAVLPAAGGWLLVDVRQPTGAPAALVDDPDEAQPWLAAVYGPAVAAEVAKYADDPDYSAVWRDFATVDHLSSVVTRLGLGSWLHRHWPTDWDGVTALEEDLLEVEVGGLAHLAEAMLPDLEPVRHLLSPHGALVAEQVRGLMESGQVAGHEGDVLVAALRAVVDLVDPDAPGYDACLEIAHDPRLTALTAPAVEPATAGQSWLAWLTGRLVEARERFATLATESQPSYQGTRGASAGQQPTDGDDLVLTEAVDPGQVPPRVVSSRSPWQNLHTRVWTSGSGEPTIETWVPAATTYQRSRGAVLYARAYDDTTIPVIFPLTFEAATGDTGARFVGSRVLPRAIQGELRVDVFARDYVSRPRLSDAAREELVEHQLQRIDFLKARSQAPASELLLTEQAMRAASN
ncbi:hypothetical protein RB608_10275 [Nocardioides sp. LHD-245]|uniref:hypothetical protein n=1 Tax=Nocardioides sp. LHD-245 TaxID=3051387 RepID=UPI0027E07ED8|nr:hypothetical protein [Nocardioides sp. LHD-245]